MEQEGKMTNQEALAYIDRLRDKYGALYCRQKDEGDHEEAQLSEKYILALVVAKDAITKLNKLDEAMEQIRTERDKSYECEAIGHGWGMQSALEILERAME